MFTERAADPNIRRRATSRTFLGGGINAEGQDHYSIIRSLSFFLSEAAPVYSGKLPPRSRNGTARILKIKFSYLDVTDDERGPVGSADGREGEK